MKLIALQTIKAGGKHISPYRAGSLDKKAHEFEVENREEAKALIASGAARARTSADDEEVEVVAPAANTAPRLPASGEASPPNPADVAAAAKGRPGR